MTESTLTKIQNELKAPKGQHNKFGNYDYRSVEDILESLKPLLQEHNAQLTLTDKPIMIGEWHYIEATARLLVDDKEVVNTAYARESPTKKGMDDSQITGTASSYARKYVLNGLFLIDDTKDADTNEYQKNAKRSAQSTGNSTRNAKQPKGISSKARENLVTVYRAYEDKVGTEKAKLEFNRIKSELGVRGDLTDEQNNKVTLQLNELLSGVNS